MKHEDRVPLPPIHREDCRTLDERFGWPAAVSVRCPFGTAFGWNVVIFPAD